MVEIPFPTSANVVSFELSLDENVQVNRSGWTKRRKVMGLPGAQKWQATFNPHTIYDLDDRRDWRAFLVALEGPVNNFRLPVAETQRTGSNPTVAAGANAGSTLPLTGLPAGQTVLRAGDYMTVPLPSGHHRLVLLTADLVATGVGIATAQFRPDLTEPPAQGATVETIEPFALMALTGSENGWREERGGMEINFSVEEAF